MNLSFATDSNIFSKAVEQLRAEKKPLDEDTIKERYMQLSDVVAVEFPTATPTDEPVAEPAPKKRKKRV